MYGISCGLFNPLWNISHSKNLPLIFLTKPLWFWTSFFTGYLLLSLSYVNYYSPDPRPRPTCCPTALSCRSSKIVPHPRFTLLITSVLCFLLKCFLLTPTPKNTRRQGGSALYAMTMAYRNKHPTTILCIKHPSLQNTLRSRDLSWRSRVVGKRIGSSRLSKNAGRGLGGDSVKLTDRIAHHI